MIRFSRFMIVLMVGLVVLAGAAGAQAAVTMVSERSPFRDCVADAVFDQAGDANPDSEVEPWVAVDPNDRDRVFMSWQQDRWSDGGARGIGSAVSADGGLTWETGVLPGLTVCAGGPWKRASDPWSSFGPDGVIYHTALVVNEPGEFGIPDAGGIAVQTSRDGGRQWNEPVMIVSEDDPTEFHDKVSITADPWEPNVAYVAWSRLTSSGFGVVVASSFDGGLTWSEPLALAGRLSAPVGAQIVVQPDGDLVALASDFAGIEAWWSGDQGATWEGPYEVAEVVSSSPHIPGTDVPIRSASGLFDVAVDPSTGVIQVVWEDGRFNEDGTASVVISRSFSDRVWSQPRRVDRTPHSDAAGLSQALLPSIAIDDAGQVGITYVDFRNSVRGATGEADLWGLVCDRDMVTCLEQRLTIESFDYDAAPMARGRFIGDYLGLASRGDGFIATVPQTQAFDPASQGAVTFGESDQANVADRP